MDGIEKDWYHKHVHRQLAAMTAELDSLKAVIERLTSDAAVEAARSVRMMWSLHGGVDHAGMKAAIEAAIREVERG